MTRNDDLSSNLVVPVLVLSSDWDDERGAISELALSFRFECNYECADVSICLRNYRICGVLFFVEMRCAIVLGSWEKDDFGNRWVSRNFLKMKFQKIYSK